MEALSSLPLSPACGRKDDCMALKGSRKTIKLPLKVGGAFSPALSAPRSAGPGACGLVPAKVDWSQICLALLEKRTGPGFPIDDGPRYKAPGDADRGVSRRGAGRADRLKLAAQP